MAVDAASLSGRGLWAGIVEAGPRLWAQQGSEAADSDESLREEHGRRRSFIARYGYAAPTPEAVSAIADFLGERRTLEVCAGLGLWTRLLRDAGASVLATDADPQGEAAYVCVERQDATAAVAGHPACDALLLCWPPHRKPVAADALRGFRGSRVVAVGDVRFTGDAAYHAALGRDWRLERSLPLPSWPGIEDCARLYTRKP